MGDVPNAGQLALLFAAIAAFAIGGVMSLARFWQDSERLRLGPKICLYVGILFGIGVIIWHDKLRTNWAPLDDNFDAMLWLALLLAMFVAYTQRAHPLRGLDFFIMPIVVLLLVLAAVFGKAMPHTYVETPWSLAHRITAYGGFVAFAVAAAVGTMYLLTNYRLRHKRAAPAKGFGSLERLEHFAFTSVTLGFALLTIGMITGLVWALRTHGDTSLGPHWYRNPKVLLASITWIVYALVLHSPINPSFRGRRAALLSIVGFVVMIGTLFAAQFMPPK